MTEPVFDNKIYGNIKLHIINAILWSIVIVFGFWKTPESILCLFIFAGIIERLAEDFSEANIDTPALKDDDVKF